MQNGCVCLVMIMPCWYGYDYYHYYDNSTITMITVNGVCLLVINIILVVLILSHIVESLLFVFLVVLLLVCVCVNGFLPLERLFGFSRTRFCNCCITVWGLRSGGEALGLRAVKGNAYHELRKQCTAFNNHTCNTSFAVIKSRRQPADSSFILLSAEHGGFAAFQAQKQGFFPLAFGVHGFVILHSELTQAARMLLLRGWSRRGIRDLLVAAALHFRLRPSCTPSFRSMACGSLVTAFPASVCFRLHFSILWKRRTQVNWCTFNLGSACIRIEGAYYICVR